MDKTYTLSLVLKMTFTYANVIYLQFTLMFINNAYSLLFEFDFYGKLTADILRYSSQGDSLLTGDFSARVSQLSGVIENIDLERIIGMSSTPVDNLPTRVSFYDKCNQFGNTHLNVCKENSICIINGRLEPGMYSCYKFNRTSLAASVVCYC